MKIFLAVTAETAAAGSEGGPSPMLPFLEELGELPIELALMDASIPLTEQVSDVEILIPAVTNIGADVINAAPKLKMIIQAGIGLDEVDIETATEKKIYVANVPYGSATSMGELTLAMMLLLSRRLNEAQENMRKGTFFMPNGFELGGKTLGLIGLGHSAIETAKRAKCFDMNIIGMDKFPENISCPDVDTIGGVDLLDKILTESDFVSLHCPLNDETRNMIGYDQLCKMKETAYFINIARAGLVDKEGIIQALKEKKIAGAGLDVFWEEPLPLDDELLTLNNAILTPHVATSTFESRSRNFVQVAKAIKKVANGEKPDFCANF